MIVPPQLNNRGQDLVWSLVWGKGGGTARTLTMSGSLQLDQADLAWHCAGVCLPTEAKTVPRTTVTISQPLQASALAPFHSPALTPPRGADLRSSGGGRLVPSKPVL